MSMFPTPRGRQHHVVGLSSNQHHVVLGTAGTGKSTMAIMRAQHLARPTTENHGPVLVVTYNSTLVTYLLHLGAGARGDTTIETYGRFARGYLNSLGLMHWNAIAGPDQVRQFVWAGVAAAKSAGHTNPVLDRDLDWIIDEVHWISGMGIDDVDVYDGIDRVGRQTPLLRGSARRAVWEAREQYRRARIAAGLPYDWYDIATVVRTQLLVDARPRMYKHIIIDEGQDLSPEALRSLVASVAPGGSLTFFGDYHQAIYGQGMSWRKAGIDLGSRRIETFTENLRNTAQIAAIGIALAQSKHMATDDLDLVMPSAPTAAGPMPTLVRMADTTSEASYLRELARDMSRDQSVAILARTWPQARAVAKGLAYTPLKDSMSAWDSARPGLYVGAYHSAKGLEFDAVLLPFLNDDTFPHRDVLSAYSEDEACSREARLLYVAITRARFTLVMSHSGTVSRLLPPHDGLWKEETA